MHILVAVDGDSLGSMVKALLDGQGHSVEVVASSSKAVEQANKRVPDIVVLDAALPGGAIDLCRRFRDEPELRASRVIIVSTSGDDAARDEATDAGAIAFYTKPFSPLALLKEIESLYRRASTPRIRTSKET